jgi:hypothetical protein
MKRFSLGQCLGLMLLAYGAPAAAHHSFAMFDRDRTVSIDGTVKTFEIINPHGWLRMLVEDPGGSQNEWSIELGGPGQLDRMGLTQSTIHAGDKIAVQIHPFRDGSYGGQFVSATLPNGQVIGRPPGPA